jgi:glycosyltransferase involved in cell wall biosynthesis
VNGNGHPELSVIITTYNAAGTIERCLQSLRAQRTDRRYEVIVVDSGQDGTARRVREGFPEGRLLSFATRKYCGEARNRGIPHARGRLVAFTDADCTVAEDWVKRICLAHQEDHLAIGGSIANGPSPSLVAWAASFCEFSQWMPGLPAAAAGVDRVGVRRMCRLPERNPP